LLILVPRRASRGRPGSSPHRRRDKPLTSNSGAPPAASPLGAMRLVEFKTAWRGWRDFRIALASSERGEFGCQKIGRPAVAAIA